MFYAHHRHFKKKVRNISTKIAAEGFHFAIKRRMLNTDIVQTYLYVDGRICFNSMLIKNVGYLKLSSACCKHFDKMNMSLILQQ